MVTNVYVAKLIVIGQWVADLLVLVGDQLRYAGLRLELVGRELLEQHGRRLLRQESGQGVIEWLVLMAIVVALAFVAVKVLGPIVGTKVGDIAACVTASGRGANGVGTCTLGG
jgi:hypothetical protein